MIASRLRVSLLFSSLSLLAALPLHAQGVFKGELANDLFGAALRGVGDLNNDGFEDFAIGAPANDNDGDAADAGRVYIYFGRAQNLPEVPDLTLSVDAPGALFGSSVAGIGHYNNDNFDDLLVGAPSNDNGGVDRGSAFIFFGGSPMNAGSDVTLTGVQGGDQYGFAVAGGFDFNNDSFDDFAVGAPDRPANGVRSGEVRIYYGGNSPSKAAAVIVAGEQADDQFGFSVSRAGDVNNDGFDDVVVGAPQQFASNPGRATILLGRNGVNPPLRVTLAAESGNDRFGWSVAGGGNLDNDAFDDVAVGAPREDFGGTNNGAVYVFLGGSPMNGTHDGKVGGRQGGDELGTSVALGGDYNDDGRSDLVSGAPLASQEGEDAGEILLWPGGSPLNVPGRLVFPGPSFSFGSEASDLFGAAVDFVDFNGDGHSEVVGGAPLGNLPGGQDAGLASMEFYPGTLVPVLLADFSIIPAGDRARLSWRVTDDGSLLGFHVERRQPGGTWVRITDAILTGDPAGAFQHEDRDPVLSLGGYFEYRLIVLDRNGLADSYGPFGIAMVPSLRPLLDQNYPNPFAAPATSIPVQLREAADATIVIFDAQGRRVRELFSGRLEAGLHVMSWDGRDDQGFELPSGHYLYRLESGRTVVTRKLTLAR